MMVDLQNPCTQPHQAVELLFLSGHGKADDPGKLRAVHAQKRIVGTLGIAKRSDRIRAGEKHQVVRHFVPVKHVRFLPKLPEDQPHGQRGTDAVAVRIQMGSDRHAPGRFQLLSNGHQAFTARHGFLPS